MHMMFWKRAATVAALSLFGFSGLQAQTPEQFYKGKTVDLTIGYPPGGSNDIYARILAQHLGKHIPGQPTVVARNLPGAGSFLAVNQMAATAPRDGAAIAIGAPTLAIDEKLGTQGVRYKTSEFNWIGRISPLINIVMIWNTVPVKTHADTLKTEVKMAGTGVGSTVSIYPTVMNNVFGAKYKLVMGYKGSADAMLALERGEVEGHSTSWEALKGAHPHWYPEKKVSIPVQFALKPHPELPEVPTALSFARNDEERRILGAILNATEVGTSFFTTPGVPADRVTALRRAFDATMADPAFRADLQKARISLNPMKGEDLQALVKQVNDLPDDLVEKVRKVYQN
jgi:tripartite-type tricarboxylate transporter receptor subunit TctC